MFSQPSSVKIALLDVPRMAPEMILPALLCTDSVCDCSSFVQLSKTISEYSKGFCQVKKIPKIREKIGGWVGVVWLIRVFLGFLIFFLT